MIQAITTWVENPNAYLAVAAVLGILAGSVYGLIRIGRWIEKVDRTESTLQAILLEIKSDISSIKDIMLQVHSNVVKGDSPLQLTDRGEEIAQYVEAEEWAGHLAQKHASWYRGLQPYEIDEKARAYVDSNPKDVQVMVAKARYEFGIDAASVRAVLSIVLREAAIKRLGLHTS